MNANTDARDAVVAGFLRSAAAGATDFTRGGAHWTWSIFLSDSQRALFGNFDGFIAAIEDANCAPLRQEDR